MIPKLQIIQEIFTSYYKENIQTLSLKNQN